MGYSWAWIFGLYHPCIKHSGLTHAWSIWVFAVCIFEYIIEYWALWCNGSSDSTQLYTDVIRIPMILRCTLVQ